MSTATVTVEEWLSVRTEVAAVLKAKTTSTVTEKMAEALLEAGVVDVEAVLARIQSRKPRASALPEKSKAVTI